jgi:hypothetical protein
VRSGFAMETLSRVSSHIKLKGILRLRCRPPSRTATPLKDDSGKRLAQRRRLLMRRRTISGARSQGRDRARGFFLAEGLQGRFQGDLQHLIHRIHEMQLHGIA